MFEIQQFLVKRLQTGISHDAVGRFEIGKNKRLLRGFEPPKSLFKFFAGIHADFGVSQ